MTTWGRLSLGLLLLSLTAGAANGAEPEPKRVLVVHSFGSTAPPFTTHSTAFQTTLTKELGERVDMDEVSLDMARYAQPDMEGPFVDFLLARLAKWQPDLVVPIGSPAGRFVVKYRDRLFPEAPIIYTGMDRRTLPDDAFRNNATFVGESFDLAGLVEDILQLAPDTNHIAVVIGASALERFWTTIFQKAFEPFQDRVRFSWLNDLSFDELLQRVATLPPRSFVLLALLIRDASGVTHNQDDALQQLHAVANAPINGLYQNQLGLGLVGGRLYQAEAQGEASARIAIRILRGEPVSRLPPQVIPPLSPRYNWRELRRWNISEKRLPPGSVILFRQPPLWQEYRWHVVSAAGLMATQAVLIVALLVQRRRRREAQAALRQAETAAQIHLNQIVHLDRLAAMGHLVASLAHELGQPLTGILTNAQAGRRLLASPELTLDELRSCLDDIVNDDRRADAVIQRVWQLLKKAEFVRTPIALNDLAADTIRLVANDALLHAVSIEFLPAAALPVTYGDRLQIQQVILNLLTNAIGAAANGGPPTRKVIVWTAAAAAPYLELGVHDSGKGIAESDLERIFEPFFTTKHDGLGMGLAISRTIAHAHGGRLLVDNDPDGGAIFRLYLRAGQPGTVIGDR
jgi:signal transduction histidine kinase